MTKNIVLVLVIISALLTGCSPKFRYLTPQEAKKYPVVMIANSDIECRDVKIIKGTIFIVKELGGYKYKMYSNDNILRNYVLILEKKKQLPDEALFIKLQEKYNWGFVVYPNGQFVYDNYFTFQFNSKKLNTATGQKCIYNGNPPFILKNNR